MKNEKSHWPALGLATLTGINLFNYLDRMVLPAVLTPLKNELRLTDGQLGTVAVAFMLGYFITSPFFGYLGDRWPRKWLIAAGVLVWSVGTVLSGRATSFAELIFFRILVGLGEASYGTISPGWIADLYPSARRNNALTIFYVAIPVGSAFGYKIGGVMATHFGWRSAFLWAGAPGLLLALALLFLREPARGASEEATAEAGTPPDKGGFSVYLGLRKYPAYLIVVAGYTAQTFALGGFSYWGPVFLQRVHEMSLDRADGFFGLSLVVTGLLATLSGGYIATAWQRRSPAGYAWVLGVSAALAVPTAFAAFLLPDTGAAKIALIASMFLLFLSTGPTNTLIVESVPMSARASAMAASIFCIHLFGDLFSPRIVGGISDRTGSLQKAMLVLPAALIVSAGFWIWLVWRTHRQARPA